MEGNNKLTPLGGMNVIARNLGQAVSTISRNPDNSKACRIYDTSGGGMHLWVVRKSHDVWPRRQWRSSCGSAAQPAGAAQPPRANVAAGGQFAFLPGRGIIDGAKFSFFYSHLPIHRARCTSRDAAGFFPDG
jgi:hypothetical protein